MGKIPNVGGEIAGGRCPKTDMRYTCSVRFRSARGEVAAVGVQHLPDHVAGVLAREEQETRRHLIGLTGSTDGRVLSELRNVLRFLAAERVERRPYRSRRDRVDADPL